MRFEATCDDCGYLHGHIIVTGETDDLPYRCPACGGRSLLLTHDPDIWRDANEADRRLFDMETE